MLLARLSRAHAYQGCGPEEGLSSQPPPGGKNATHRIKGWRLGVHLIRTLESKIEIPVGEKIMSSTTENIKDKIEKVAEKAKDATEKVAEKAKDATEKVADKTKDAVHKAGEKLKGAGERLKHSTD
jgi:hypothetical protein